MASTTGVYDELVFTTGDELWDRVHQAHRRFAALLSVTPGKTELKGSYWNAAQVAGHVLNVLNRYTDRDITSREGLSAEGSGVTQQNDAELEALGQYSVAEVLDRTWQALADIEKKLPRDMDLHQRFPFHGGQEFDGAAALSNLVGEFLIHGRDVALARGKQWKIGSRNAAMVLATGFQVAPGYVRADAPGDLKLEIRTPETNAWVLDLVDGELTSRKAGRREGADVIVYGRTEALLLNLYGRFGLGRATLHGITVVGGRRPWRIARLPRTFLVP
ncbi:hypothetical protein [Nocardioides marmorisolisilvae]|uniref:Mycothiol-dependent maleylpyruvate isomerase metal-binding domain-containing protein n=1 Tax=Nocardioides marmorisolisilvae TaxID=1542737 RepID=A0A3N0DTX2_9ACTN|nr:hypothetical protein [Nocardioides marmorisolisilvae]RNL78843.1 hypothetical protein EFL95_07200 [Nocardioides marmorisolisilvae]